MKLNTASRARLYALTCIAMMIWLVQTVMQSEADGTLFSWSSLVFIACIATVTVYCGYCAVKDWNVKDPAEGDDAGDGDADATKGGKQVQSKK